MVVFISDMTAGGCKIFLPILVSSYSDDTVIAGADKGILCPWSELIRLSSSVVPMVGAAVTAAAK
jgi:hypothetical protein